MYLQNQQGFSLTELLIVVVIIAIIGAIAIPNVLTSRRAANEGSAISSLHIVHSAQMTYLATMGAGNFAGSLDHQNFFPILAATNLIDSSLGSSTKNGYTFLGYGSPAQNGRPSTFIAGANPVTSSGVSQTGTRNFLMTVDGVIHYDDVEYSNGMYWNYDPVTNASPIFGGQILGKE